MMKVYTEIHWHHIFLIKHVFKRSFPGVAHILKLFSPRFLYRRLVHGSYDIVVSYLEGQTARIISGCPDSAIKKVCWIHRTMTNLKDSARLFRNVNEAKKCYSSFDRIISVSKDVQMLYGFVSYRGKGDNCIQHKSNRFNTSFGKGERPTRCI